MYYTERYTLYSSHIELSIYTTLRKIGLYNARMPTGQCKRCYTNKMNRNKAHPAGMDGITTTLVQRVYGETVVKAMHCIVTKTRQEKEMQEDWENSTIVPLYKSNGDIHGVVKIMQVFAYTEHSRESLHQNYKKKQNETKSVW